MSILDHDFPLIPCWLGYSYTPVVPKIYWNVKSQEQRIKMLCLELYKLIEYSDNQSAQINQNTQDIEELDNILQKFMESGFDDYYKAQIEQWVKDNLWSLYETFCKQVLFGLTLDGYFVAYIPDSWDDILFDTGAVFGEDTYGRLILRYDVNQTYNVSQTTETSSNGIER